MEDPCASDDSASDSLIAPFVVPRTVLMVDLVDSVRWMQAHEAGTIEAWGRFVAAVRSDLRVRDQGRVVKSYGDGLLLEFGDTEQAARSARRLHVLMDEVARNSGLALRLRCGLHSCQLRAGPDDVYGEGVNLVARLVGLAAPGGTVCSLQVRDELAAGADFPAADLGPCFLKGYDDPVRAFALGDSPEFAAAFAFVPALPSAPPGSPPPGDDVRPIIALIPFDAAPGARGDVAAARALGDAVADDLYARLARCSDVRVLSRWSAARLRGGEDLSPAALRTRLGAHYALLGHAAALDGGRWRCAVQFLDLDSGEPLWAEAPVIDSGLLFRGEEAALAELTASILRSIALRAVQRSRALPFPNLDGYMLYGSAAALTHRLSPVDFLRARPMLEHLCGRFPRSGRAQALRALWHYTRLAQHWSDDAERDRHAALDAGTRAVELHPDDGFAHTARAMAQIAASRDPILAESTCRQALALDPNEPWAWALLSGMHSYQDDGAEAVRAAERALTLSPLDPARHVFEAYRALALLTAGRDAEAAAAARASVQLNAMNASAMRLLAMALVLSGDEAGGREAGARFLALQPRFTVATYLAQVPGGATANALRRAEALRAAGLPA